MSDPSLAVYVAKLTGGGILPDSGAFTPATWGTLIGMSVDYLEKFFKDADVPYVRLGGDVRFYSAEDVRARLPMMSASTDPKRKHGGPRSKRKA